MQRRGLLSCTLSLTSHVFTLFMGAGVPLHMSQHILNVRLCPHSAAVPSKCVQRATLSPQRLGGGGHSNSPQEGSGDMRRKRLVPVLPLRIHVLFFASSHYVQNVFGLLKTCSCRCRVQAGCAEISQREDIKARLVWFQLHREFLLRLIIVPV